MAGPASWLVMGPGGMGAEGVGPGAGGGDREGEGPARPGSGITPAAASRRQTGMRLIITMDCESTETAHPKTYIENDVIEGLRQWRNEDGELLFERVRLLGKMAQVFRRAEDGTVVASDTADEVVPFVAFSLEALVKTGKGADAASESADRPRGRVAR